MGCKTMKFSIYALFCVSFFFFFKLDSNFLQRHGSYYCYLKQCLHEKHHYILSAALFISHNVLLTINNLSVAFSYLRLLCFKVVIGDEKNILCCCNTSSNSDIILMKTTASQSQYFIFSSQDSFLTRWLYCIDSKTQSIHFYGA